jgi:hypothetical protein
MEGEPLWLFNGTLAAIWLAAGSVEVVGVAMGGSVGCGMDVGVAVGKTRVGVGLQATPTKHSNRKTYRFNIWQAPEERSNIRRME